MRRPAPALVLAALLGASLQATAQMGGGPMGGRPGGMGEGRGGPMRPADADVPAPARAGIAPLLQQLQGDLALSAQQQPAWDALRLALLDVEWPRPQAVSASAQASAMGALQQELTQAQNRYALLEAAADRLRALQALATPAQQARLDAQLPAIVQQAASAGGPRPRRAAGVLVP